MTAAAAGRGCHDETALRRALAWADADCRMASVILAHAAEPFGYHAAGHLRAPTRAGRLEVFLVRRRTAPVVVVEMREGGTSVRWESRVPAEVMDGKGPT